MNKSHIILFVLSFLFLFSCESSINEKEPNDLWDKATKIYLTEKLIVNGELKSCLDKDYYLLDLSNLKYDKGTLNIKVNGVKGLDLKLSIFNEGKEDPIKQVNDFMPGYGESLSGIGIEKGKNLILLLDTKLTSLDKMNLGEIEFDNPDYPFVDYKDYHMEIEIKPQTDYEIEPNDTFKSANKIIIGRPLTAYFTPFLKQNIEKEYIESLGTYNNYEIDLYKIVTKKNHSDSTENNTEDIFISINLSEVENVNSLLLLFDENKEILEFIDNHTFGLGEKILNYSLKKNYDYYIGVIGIHNIKIQKPDYYKYNLIVNSIDDDLNIEREDNDSYEKANVLTKGIVSGYISPIDDEDWYEIVVPETEFYDENAENDNDNQSQNDTNPPLLAEIKVTGLEGVDIELDISKNGKNIDFIYDNAGVSEGETISNATVDKLKKIYIRVVRSENDKKKFINEESKYVLSYRFYNQYDNMELEPNDEFYQATPIEISKLPIIGYISPKEDIDNYLIKIDNSRTYSIQLTTVDGLELQWLMYEKGGLQAPNVENPEEYEFTVKPKGTYHGYFKFKYIGTSYTGEEELILSVKDYKRSKFNGLGYNTSQMYKIRIIPRE